MTRYHISSKTTIELNEEGKLTLADIDIAIMAALGFEAQNEDGLVVWTKDQERYWLVSQRELPQAEPAHAEAVKTISENARATALLPSRNLSVAQTLMRQVPMNVTGEPFANGALAGNWRVERINEASAGDSIMTGLTQPMSIMSPHLPLAVSLLFLQAIGVGQRAYVYIPERADRTPGLVYITSDNEKSLLDSQPPYCLYRAESLDKYAVTGLNEDLVKGAIETAQLQRTIRMAQAKTDAPQPQPELVATATEIERPEAE